MTHVHVRNVHPTRRLMVPIAPGWSRLLYPAVTACLPAGVVESPAVRRMLAAQVLAVVGEAGWDADARQRQADRAGMEAAIRRAEQREFDQWRARWRARQQPPRRTHKSAQVNRKRRADEWPPEWTERLRRRWAEGASAEQIASEIGLTPGAVASKALREGLEARPPRNAWPAERTVRLRERWAAGATARELAGELGVTPGAVVSKARTLGLPGRPRSYWTEACRRAGQASAARRWGTLEGPAAATQPRQDDAGATGR